MIAGIQKKDRNLRIQLDGQLRQQHVFSLKTASQARVLFACDFTGECRAHFIQLELHLRMDFRCAHHRPAFSEGMKMPVSCNKRWTAEMACIGS